MVQIRKLFKEVREESAALAWEGTFKEYLNMVIKNPHLARLSHRRIYDMLQWAGVRDSFDGTHRYDLFTDQIFGSDKTLERLVQFFRAAAEIPEERRRILLLLGPPGSGKSTIVNLIKKGLERYSRTEEGAIYAIAGCPMQEEPLRLIPENRRDQLTKDYNLLIEGDLCPRCRDNLRHQYGGDISKVRIKRISFSEAEGIGLGSFVATSPEGQDVSRLVGTIDVDSLAGDRLEGSGKAFRLDGELEAANRGIMEFIQLFRSDDRFLTIVLGVTQEQIIKLGSFGSVYADEVIIAHSNEAEYNSFIANKQTEALLDRLIMVKVPYNLRLGEEIKIYRKLLADGHPSSAHMSPLTLPLIASVAVLSRLEGGQKVARLPRPSLLDKMEMYEGRLPPRYTQADVAALQEESSREGMFGLSPRFVINPLSEAIARESECLTPLEALGRLLEGLEERAGLSQEERERITTLLPEIIKGYRNRAVQEVQRAATERFEELAQGQLDSYVKDAKTFCIGQESESLGTTRIDDHLMRRVEGAIDLRDVERGPFRQGVYRTLELLQQQGRTPSYDDFPLLKIAIEKLLLPNTREMMSVLDPGQVDPDQLQQRKMILGRLTSIYGYCNKCAQDVVDFVRRTLQNQEVVSIKRGKLVRQ